MYSLRFLKHFRKLSRSQSIVASSCQQNSEPLKHKFLLSKPVFDENFLLDPRNIEEISENIKLRKGVGDIHLVHELKNKLSSDNLSSDTKITLQSQLQEELKKIPNATHEEVKSYGDDPKVVAYVNSKPEFKHQPLEFSEICKKLNLLRTDHLGNFNGHKSYYLMSDVAELVSLMVSVITSV